MSESREHRLHELRARADEMDVQRRIIRKHSDSETNELREKATDIMLKLQLHKEAVAAYTEQNIKPLNGELKTALGKLRTEMHDEVVECQGIINAERGIMEYFDNDGELVDVRNLTREERSQLPFPKTGSRKVMVGHGLDEQTGGFGIQA